MVSRAQKALRRFLIRLFFEALHVVDRVFELLVQRFTLLDVTISRRWERRRDPKGHQVVLLRYFKSLAQQIMEQITVADEMVRRQDRHGSLRVTLAQYHGCQANHRGSTARRRLDEIILRGNLRDLFLHFTGLPLHSHHQDALGREELDQS